jgi:small GTP-binding protein
MGSCSSTPDPSAASPGDNLDVKTKDRSGAVPKAVNYQFKLALIGDSGVGKTSVRRCYMGDEFRAESLLSTVGVDWDTKSIVVDGVNVTMKIWDTAGQERFKSLTRNYFRGAHGIMIFYDVSSITSFKNVQNWLNEIAQVEDNVQKLLIGNKSDLDHIRQVSIEEGRRFASQHDMLFFETSASSGANVKEVFTTLAKLMKETLEHSVSPVHSTDSR